MTNSKLCNGDVTALVAELERENFYGSLEVKFEAGHVVLIRKTETLKSPQDFRASRGNYDRQQH